MQAHMPDLTASLHPAMAAALAQHLTAHIQVRRAQYVADLIRMDWQFEAAEGAPYRAGRKELERLRAEQAEVDPQAVLWNRHAHRDYFKVPA